MDDRRKSYRVAPRRHGARLLAVLLAVTVLGVFRFANFPAAQQARQTLRQAVYGNETLSGVLAAFGGEETQQMLPTAETKSSSAASSYAVSSGSADDLLQRDATLFPDTVDETVYPMDFAHCQPAAGSITSVFGARISPLTGQPGFHYGTDIAADEGTPIGAFAEGTVREVGESSYGKYVIIDHAGGFATLYAHCSSISAAVGDAVTCGQEIARVGQTGNATGPHLHLEIWKNGAALDPARYLTAQ